MQRRKLRAVALAAAATLALPQALAVAQDGSESGRRFERLSGLSKLAGFKPAMLDVDRRANVIVELRRRSVGQVEARSRRNRLSARRERSLTRQLRREQSPVKSRIRALGGRVTFDYQNAYNGVAARVPVRAVARLEQVRGVVAVHPSRTFERANIPGIQFIRGNEAWTDLGLTGENVTVGVLDTGVDYLHANFGGSGDPDEFENNDGTVIEPGTFPTAKVAGGTDFVGDDYDDSSDDPTRRVPHPDEDPLDCQGHGSHVAGSAAGFGVLADGSTYQGPYDATTYSNEFEIGPGVAPRALVHAYRVFGCEGSTSEDVLVAAIDRAVDDGVDVINMSLGSPFGRADEPSVVASEVASLSGTMVVASSGNSGAGAYVTGAPAIASRALSVAALDASGPTLPGAVIDLGGTSITAINANEADIPGDPMEVAVLRESYPDGPVALGCDPAEYANYPGGVEGKLVVTLRGVCARVARAIFGEQAGAAAVAMINTSPGLPPFEGPITSNPDTGEKFTVTIPFLGIAGCYLDTGTCSGTNDSTDPETLVGAEGTPATLSPTTVPNPGFKRLASFTSGGPRNLDSAVKPDVTAPGVSVLSTAAGTGTGGTRMSGTSMASPMTAGAAALVKQAHVDWSVARLKAAIMNTANSTPEVIEGSGAGAYNPRVAGTGVVDARRAVDSSVLATTNDGSHTLSFGQEAAGGAYSETLTFNLENTGASDVTYNLAPEFNGSPLGSTLSLNPTSVTVPAGSSETVEATLSLSEDAVAALPPAEASILGSLVTIRGAVVATPDGPSDGVYSLRVPFLVAPRGLSDITSGPRSPFRRAFPGNLQEADVPVTNNGVHAGFVDVYGWGIEDAADQTERSMDIRAAGVQTLPREVLCGPVPAGECGTENDRSLIFAVNMYGMWSNPSVNEVDIAIDTIRGPAPDFFVVGVDIGAVTAGAFDGRFASVIFDARGNLIDAWVAVAPMNGSTMLLPVLASELHAERNRAFDYSVASFSIVPEGLADFTGTGKWITHRPVASSGDFVPLGPGESDEITVTIRRGNRGGLLGWMFVNLNDPVGAAQADFIRIRQ